MKTNNYLQMIANVLANESISTSFNYAFGDTKTNAASISDTDLDNELGRETCEVDYNNNTFKFSKMINGFDSAYDGETIEELGVFDADTSGNLISRTTEFSPITIDSETQYFFTNFSEINQDANTVKLKITDKAIENIYQNLVGTSTDYPTHVAFSTHLILDTFNATTGWTATGGAVATSTNRKEGTNSLALTKSTTGSATSYMVKTPTAIDVSDAETIRLWIRINSSETMNKLTESDCLEIRYGSDSSNYKSITVDRSSLNTIWTLLELSVADFADTGSPTTSAIDYLYIGLTSNNATDVWTGEEVLFDFMSAVWALSESDNTLHEEVVRKAIDTIEIDGTTLRYTGLLSTAEGNTYNYFYVGLFDDASSGDMFLVNQLYLTEKDDNRQLNFYIEVGVRFV